MALISIKQFTCLMFLSLAIFYSSNCELPLLQYKEQVASCTMFNDERPISINSAALDITHGAAIVSYSLENMPTLLWTSQQENFVSRPLYHERAKIISHQPNNSNLTIIHYKDYLVVYNLNTNVSINYPLVHSIFCLAFDYNDSSIYAASANRTILSFNLHEVLSSQPVDAVQHDAAIIAMNITPPGDYLITRDFNKFCIWDTGEMSVVRSCIIAEISQTPIHSTYISLSMDGKYLFACMASGGYIFDIQQIIAQEQRRWPYHNLAIDSFQPYLAQWGPDNSWIVVAYSNGENQLLLTIWDLRNNSYSVIHDLEQLDGVKQRITTLSISDDGKQLYALLNYGEIVCWDIIQPEMH